MIVQWCFLCNVGVICHAEQPMKLLFSHSLVFSSGFAPKGKASHLLHDPKEQLRKLLEVMRLSSSGIVVKVSVAVCIAVRHTFLCFVVWLFEMICGELSACLG